MKIKIEIEIEKDLYEKVKNLESIDELIMNTHDITYEPVTFERFIELHIAHLFKYDSITKARKDIKLYHPRKNYSLDRAIQIIASLYSDRVADQIRLEINRNK